ncbi:hypothetical protein [Ruegeria sp. A3M17]|uniref:hypothetical protein n=1 Tax=Ruegeria sp. A3M17 TaxID=2267229 RepID=UPI000DEA70DE|nr:hypothetical protein [Ruegeria sp. A3M17]
MILVYFLTFAVFVGAFFFFRSFSEGLSLALSFVLIGALIAIICIISFFSMSQYPSGDFTDQIYQRFGAYFIVAPLGAAAAGMAVGGLVNILRLPMIVQLVVVCLVLAVPVAIGVNANNQEEQERKRKAAYRAAMELTNVSGTFGSETVTIPVSPIVSVGTRCKVRPGESDMKCQASFDQSNTFEVFHGFGLDNLDFSALIVWHPGPDCRVQSKCGQFRSWCERRPDMTKSVWCWSEHKLKIVMRTDRKHRNEEDIDKPLLTQSNPVAGLRIRCREGLFKPWCKAHFEVAPDVRTIVTVEDIEPGHEETVVREAVSYAQSLWLEMTRKK